MPFPITIRVDAAKPVGIIKPIWRFFGADEPNYATMKDGKKLLGQIGELRPGIRFSAPTIYSAPATASPR